MELSKVRSYVNDFSSNWGELRGVLDTLEKESVAYQYLEQHMDSDERFNNWRNRIGVLEWVSGVEEVLGGDLYNPMVRLSVGSERYYDFAMCLDGFLGSDVLGMDFVMYMRYWMVRMALDSLVLELNEVSDSFEDFYMILEQQKDLNRERWSRYLDTGEVDDMFHGFDELVELFSMENIHARVIKRIDGCLEFYFTLGSALNRFNIGIQGLIYTLLYGYRHYQYKSSKVHLHFILLGLSQFARYCTGSDSESRCNAIVIKSLCTGLSSYFVNGKLFLER